MFMGMTYGEFWDGDIYAVAAYRKAYEYRRTEQNQLAWLQGLYNYKAVQTAVAEFSYGLNGKKGKKPDPYLKEPLPLTNTDKDIAKEKAIQHTMDFFAQGEKNGGTGHRKN